MVDVTDAFFLPTGDPTIFCATGHTQGPWTPGIQHAGPPSALLTRAIEELPSSIAGPSSVARLTMDILGPIPTGEVTVTASVVRPGRTVELIEGELAAGGRVALRARAWRIRAVPVPLPFTVVSDVPALPPAGTEFHDTKWKDTYLDAVDFRFTEGTFDEPGPAAVWTRLRRPLVADEPTSPLQRLMAVADSGNGLSSELPFEGWWFINTDLTVHLHRLPRGEWIHVTARSTLDPLGIGLAETVLSDMDGRVGRGAQALMVGPR
jgi:hypothetical protein